MCSAHHDFVVARRTTRRSRAVPRHWLLVLGVVAMTTAGCTGSDGGTSSDGGTTTGTAPTETPPTTTGEFAAFTSTGVERDGWYWLEEPTATARWELTDLPEGVADVPLDVRAMVSSDQIADDGAGTLSMDYGQGDATLGTQEVKLLASPVIDHPELALLDGSLIIPDLPDGLTALWVEVTAPADGTVVVVAESVQLGSPPTALTPVPAEAQPTYAPSPINRVDGEFTTNGDEISGWWWIRDEALQHYARWSFASVPTLSSGVTVQFHVLATEGVNGGPGVAARFYLTYGFTDAAGGAVVSETESNFAPPRPPPDTVDGATTVLVTIPNVSPPGDPLGYTAQDTLKITAAEVPGGAVSVWFEASRADPTQAGAPTSEHVAFNAASLGLLTQATGADGTGGSNDEGGGVETDDGVIGDPDGLADTDSPDEADDVGDLPPGTYHGTLDGEDDDWFAFQVNSTQIVDFSVVADGGLIVEVELFDVHRSSRTRFYSDEPSVIHTCAADRGNWGTWYLSVHRISGGGTYTFSIGVRDPDDAFRGIDAGDDAATAMAIGAGDITGEISGDDAGDHYMIDVAAGQTMAVGLVTMSDSSFELELREDGSLVAADVADPGEPASTFVEAGDARSISIAVDVRTAPGGQYRMRLTLSGVGECTTDPIAAAAFASSGNPKGIIAGTHPGWFWLRGEAGSARSQQSTWTFDALPNDTTVRVMFDVPVDVSAPVAAAAYVTYGLVDGTTAVTIGSPKLVTFRTEQRSGTFTGASAVGELDIPHSDLSAAVQAWWVRLTLFDPTAASWATLIRVGLGTASNSAVLCPGSGTTALDGLDGPIDPDAADVTFDGATHTLTSDVTMFVDPGSDVDGDGLNQSWENSAIELANPVVQLDEEELWFNWRADLPTVNFVEATLWPSYANPQYIVLAYLNTWAYDPGGGVMEPVNFAYQNHRGDSELIWQAWKVLDAQHVQLEWVNTSAHKSYTDHSGVWHVSDRQCNKGNVASATLDGVGYGYYEVMCSGLNFDGEGRLLISSARDKHAMYPSDSVCNAATIGVAGALSYTERCGWDVFGLPFGLGTDDSDLNDDPNYLGDGRWQFDVYNVGEPGYPLIDDLDQPSTWVGLTSEQVGALAGAYPGEAVWSGHLAGSDFCGGLVQGDTLALDWSDDVELPAKCSSRLGSKFEDWQSIFVESLAARYRVTLQTGTVDGAGTDDPIYIKLSDSEGTVLATATLYGDLESGAIDIVYPRQHTWSGGNLDSLSFSRLGLEDGTIPNWYLASVTVEDLVTGQSTTYTVNQWIPRRLGAGTGVARELTIR